MIELKITINLKFIRVNFRLMDLFPEKVHLSHMTKIPNSKGPSVPKANAIMT